LPAVLRPDQFVAYETGGQIHIVPNALMRTVPSRILQEDDHRVSDSEVVTRILEVSGISAAQLVPILRPMMGQSPQLTASQNNNRLVIVDYYDNVRRSGIMQGVRP
jgi:general secretion pathway protein D